MYAEGLLGNQKIIPLLGTLINGVFNYIRPSGANPYELKTILGSSYDYIYPPETEQEKKERVNQKLLAFMSQAPGFNKDLFEVDHGK